jgi:hypothetical protein
LKRRDSAAISVREFWYQPVDFATWIANHRKWWPKCEDVSVWGRFAGQACSGRHLFSGRDQCHRYFGETLVARHYEEQGYVCWTLVRVLRKPGRVPRGTYGTQTKLVEALLSESTGIVPQLLYQK